MLIACGNSNPRDVPSHPPVARDDAAPPDATHVRAAQRVVGTLYPKFDKTRVWPSRVCVDGNELVFENDCGCNDRLVCQLDRVARATLYVSLETDPTRMRTCDDCFPMIPGRCALPAPSDDPAQPRRDGLDTWTLVIGGQAALELPVDRAGLPPDGSCWAARP